MSTCGEISASILANCDNQITGGANARLLLANKADVPESAYTYNTLNPKIIESITLSSSPAAYFYAFEGFKSSVAPQIATVDNPYRKAYNHQIDFIVFANTPEAKLQLEGMADGTLIAIVENNDTGVGGNAAFELYGKKQGLFGSIVRVVNDADTQGAYRVTIQSPKDSKEPSLPATIWDTSYAVTKAMIDALVA
jgi:hypothetical protein